MATAVSKMMDPEGIGDTIYKVTDIENVLTVLEIDACELVSIEWTGQVNEICYLKFYNDVNATVGTTAPVCQIPVDNTAVTFSGYFRTPVSDVFTAGLAIACTTEAGTAGTTNPTAAVNCNITVRAA